MNKKNETIIPCFNPPHLFVYIIPTSCTPSFGIRHQIKRIAKQNENVILGSIGIATVALILCVMYMLWMRPRFLYMPIYENYEKDSDATRVDGTGTELVEGYGEEGEELL